MTRREFLASLAALPLMGEERVIRVAANGLSNDVSVIDTAAGRVVATVKVGEGAWGIAISPLRATRETEPPGQLPVTGLALTSW